MELDQNKMQQLLEFWQSHAQEQPEMLLDLMKLAAESEEELEVDHDDALAEMMTLLQDKAGLSQFQTRRSCRHPTRLSKTRCVWLQYLEALSQRLLSR